MAHGPLHLIGLYRKVGPGPGGHAARSWDGRGQGQACSASRRSATASSGSPTWQRWPARRSSSRPARASRSPRPAPANAPTLAAACAARRHAQHFYERRRRSRALHTFVARALLVKQEVGGFARGVHFQGYPHGKRVQRARRAPARRNTRASGALGRAAQPAPARTARSAAEPAPAAAATAPAAPAARRARGCARCPAPAPAAGARGPARARPARRPAPAAAGHEGLRRVRPPSAPPDRTLTREPAASSARSPGCARHALGSGGRCALGRGCCQHERGGPPDQTTIPYESIGHHKRQPCGTCHHKTCQKRAPPSQDPQRTGCDRLQLLQRVHLRCLAQGPGRHWTPRPVQCSAEGQAGTMPEVLARAEGRGPVNHDIVVLLVQRGRARAPRGRRRRRRRRPGARRGQAAPAAARARGGRVRRGLRRAPCARPAPAHDRWATGCRARGTLRPSRPRVLREAYNFGV